MLFLVDGAKYSGKTSITTVLQQDYDAIPLQIDTTDTISDDLYAKINHNYITADKFNKNLDNDEYFIYKAFFGSTKKQFVYYGFKKTDLEPDKNYFAEVSPVDAINFMEHYQNVTDICYITISDELTDKYKQPFPKSLLYTYQYNTGQFTHRFPTNESGNSAKERYYYYKDPRLNIIASRINEGKYDQNTILNSMNEYAKKEAIEALWAEKQALKNHGIADFNVHLDYFNVEKYTDIVLDDNKFRNTEKTKNNQEAIDYFIKNNNNIKHITFDYFDFEPANKPTEYERYYNTGWDFGIISAKGRVDALNNLQPFAHWIDLGPITEFDYGIFKSILHEKMLDVDLAIKKARGDIQEWNMEEWDESDWEEYCNNL